ncbi:arylesterase [uncultured Paracoccus sp.]|uniref:arylesterase n=1 Tax=uncultured Paracoccus sp. TaxID=189685 RepID=UPI00261ABE67|nr:arylesterase [uncultured Paracoccus sp.]
MIGRRALLAGAALWPLAAWTQAARAETGPRILAFGDSLTAGYGLPASKGLVPMLQDWLVARSTPARIVNRGLSGDTTYGGRVRIHWALRGGADAVIVQLGGNDMLLGWSPAQAEANLDAILTTAGAKDRPLLLVGIHAPGRRQDWRRGWAGIWPRLAARHDALLLPDLYAPLAAIPAGERKPFLLDDGIHPSAKGVELLVGHLGPQVQALIARVSAS